MKLSYGRLLVLLGGTALGIALLVLLLRSVNLGALGNAFATADYAYLALAAIPFLINWLLKVPRWSLLFGDESPGWDTLFGAMNVGYAINGLFPARLGEIVRAYWVRDRSGTGMMLTLSTIAVERVLDGTFLIILLVLMLPTVPFPHELLGPAFTLGAAFVVILLLMAVIANSSHRDDSVVGHLLDRLEAGRLLPVGKAVRQIVAGLHALRDGRTMALVLGYTAVIWGSNTFFFWFTVRAFHLDVPFAAGILLATVVNLGMAVPSSPGYVGVFEYLTVLTLSLYTSAAGTVQHPGADATAAALALHVFAYGPVTIVGLLYIARTGLSVTLQMVRAGPEGTRS
jgi:glycosyltransferase 2 family protein